jgi:hypothetical protein
MGEIVLFAFLSAVYPTLIAATTVMLLLPRAERLMFGFWLGAMIASVTCGLVIVFALDGSTAVKTTRNTISPALDLAIAGLLVLAAVALSRGEDERVRARHQARHPRDERSTPKWQQTLRDGNPWHTFVVGIVLSFPGVWYLAALDRLAKLDYRTVVVILVVVGFCLLQLILIEVPMLAFKVWPEQTPVAIGHAKAWASSHGRHYAVCGLGVFAVLLAIVGVIGLAS